MFPVSSDGACVLVAASFVWFITDHRRLPVTVELLNVQLLRAPGACPEILIMNFLISYVLCTVQGLDWALVWKFMSAFLSIVLERFEEEMKFDVMPTGTSVLESKSGWERKGG